MKRDLVVAGKGLAGAGLTGAVLYLVAIAPTHVHLYWPYWIFLAMVLVGIALYLAGHERAPAAPEQPGESDREEVADHLAEPGLVPATPVMATAGPVITDRWRQTSDGGQVPALMNLTQTVMSHPSYGVRQPQDTPPSVKIGMLVACDPLEAAARGTELRAKFAAFLETEAVRKLIGSLTYVDPGMSWKSLAGNGPMTLEAALTAAEDVLEGVPVASALLLPPVAGLSLYGRNGRAATLLLYIEPRTADGHVPPASGLVTWYERFGLALAMPGAFAGFLANDLGLGTSDDPPAQLGVWLKSYHPLTAMIDTDGLRTLPGSSPSNQFIGWAFAAPDGSLGKKTARDLLSHLCEYTLHLDSFEEKLDEISTADRPALALGNTGQSHDVPDTGELLAKRSEEELAKYRAKAPEELSAQDGDPDQEANTVAPPARPESSHPPARRAPQADVPESAGSDEAAGSEPRVTCSLGPKELIRLYSLGSTDAQGKKLIAQYKEQWREVSAAVEQVGTTLSGSSLCVSCKDPDQVPVAFLFEPDAWSARLVGLMLGDQIKAVGRVCFVSRIMVIFDCCELV